MLLNLADRSWWLHRAVDSAPRRVYVLPNHRIVWVQVAKSGCTSVIEMLSRLNGLGSLNPHEEFPCERPEVHSVHGWHDAGAHGLRRLRQCSRSLRHCATSAPDWWRFAIVRDPYLRFLSAWMDKVFLSGAHDSRLWEGVQDVCRADGRIDVTATFSQFVRSVALSPARYLGNPHFVPQHSVLCRGLFPDLDVIPLSRIEDVCSKIRAMTGQPFALGRLNKSLRLDPRGLYRRESLDLVSHLYIEDLGCDPAVTSPPDPVGEPVILTRMESELVRRVRTAARRIHHLGRRTTAQSRFLYRLRQALVGGSIAGIQRRELGALPR